MHTCTLASIPIEYQKQLNMISKLTQKLTQNMTSNGCQEMFDKEYAKIYK